MSTTDPSNELFDLAVRFVNQTDKHLFLTGKAGTGKTTFLKYIKENSFKRMIIVAPTGVAAINAGGVTIHSFFQLPFGPFVAAQLSGWNPEQQVSNQHTLLKNIRFTANKRQLLKELELIIIDEVSMMRCDMLDAIDHVLRYFRKKPHLPFGGVQMIYIGDLFQLPPVIKTEEWNILKEHYKSPFFFDARVMQQSQPVYLELKKIYRQSDITFIDLLNNIRNNQATRADLDHLHTFYKPDFIPGKKDNYIILTSHNVKADLINSRELEKLGTKTFSFEGTTTGEFNDKALPAENKLQLKEGAQIMFLKNDKGESRRYYNGKIAHITQISSDQITVQFPGDSATMILEKETWRNIRYLLNEEKNEMEEEEIGTFTQYPIRLAWAITIHKSQGLTFEQAIIDAGASFAAGQVYVALSRLTSLKGLVLHSRIQADSISTDPRVIAFTQNEKEENILRSMLQQEQLLYNSRTLVQSFDWSNLTYTLNVILDNFPLRNMPSKETAVKWVKELQVFCREQQETAVKFIRQLNQILSDPGGTDYTILYGRTKAAEAYFDLKLQKVRILADRHIKEFSTKKKTKQYVTDIETIDRMAERKRKELKNAVEMAENLVGIKETDQASAQNPELLHIDQNPAHPALSAPLHQ